MKKTLQQIVKPIASALIKDIGKQASLTQTIREAWYEARDSGITSAQFRDELRSQVGSWHLYADDEKGREVGLRTVNAYLIAIDDRPLAEGGFRVRKERNDTGKPKKGGKKDATTGFGRMQIVSAAAIIGLTKDQVKALFKAMEGGN